MSHPFGTPMSGTDDGDILETQSDGQTLAGGLGNDLYVVRHQNTVISELENQGEDRIESDLDFTLQNGSFVELIVARGSAPISLSGNSIANTLWGNGASNSLSGGGGDDGLYGDGGDDALWGGSGNDQLFGGQGSDILDGNEGDDQLFGDVGLDELGGGDGNDVIYGGVDDDVVTGGFGSDVLYGDEGNDDLAGDAGDDQLYGGSGDNRLDGGEGRDRLYGGDNDDMLDGGSDNDALFGGNGNDMLRGGVGKDKLATGEGYDSIIFDVALSKSGRDLITDFNPYTDRICLDASVFRAFAKRGALQESAFATGDSAHDEMTRIVFDKSTGRLYYDPDGTGHKNEVLLAQLNDSFVKVDCIFII